MKEKYIMSENYIPDGILHDQDLYDISLQENELILSFKIHFYPQNYSNTSLAEKYKDFTKCHVKCILKEKMLCCVFLENSINSDTYIGKCLPIKEFVQIANETIKKKNDLPWSYLDTLVSPNIENVIIELSIFLKYKSVVYGNCRVSLNTENIEFIWE